jgi:hypothetical protein
MSTLRLILALGQHRTTDTFGTLHYCTCHDKLLDKSHINECTLLNEHGKKITDIVAPLQNVDTIWELPPD